MGKRLTRIYTRTGDDGTTGLGDGTRTSKDSLRIEAIGTVDELNSWIGVLLAESLQDDVRGELEGIQHELFDFGADLSIPGRLSMNAAQRTTQATVHERPNRPNGSLDWRWLEG